MRIGQKVYFLRGPEVIDGVNYLVLLYGYVISFDFQTVTIMNKERLVDADGYIEFVKITDIYESYEEAKAQARIINDREKNGITEIKPA